MEFAVGDGDDEEEDEIEAADESHPLLVHESEERVELKTMRKHR